MQQHIENLEAVVHEVNEDFDEAQIVLGEQNHKIIELESLVDSLGGEVERLENLNNQKPNRMADELRMQGFPAVSDTISRMSALP